MFVDFVRDDDDALVACDDIHQCLQLVTRVHTARRVGRRAQQHDARTIGDGGLQLCRRHLEVGVYAGRNRHYGSTGHLHHLYVADPRRSGYHHLISGVGYGQNAVAQRLLGAIAHNYLLGGKSYAVFALELGADGTA